MTQANTAQTILAQLEDDSVKMGDLKKKAKEIKKDHDLAMTLWASNRFLPRMLAVLIMDKKQLTEDVLQNLAQDLQSHEPKERAYIADWLMANQLIKDKHTIAMLEGWQNASSPMQRRLFWYYQARLRWTGKTPPDNSAALLDALESDMADAEPEVQWAMNFAAGQIGIHESEHRSRCIALGERLGLYKDEPVPRGCTPNYLPEFIRIEVSKRNT